MCAPTAVRATRAMFAALAALCTFACSIADVDLDGRPCPCVEGYACNAATSTCERAVSMDGGHDGSVATDGNLADGNGTDGSVADGGAVDATMGADAGVTDGGTCFFDDFEDNTLDGWRVEAGNWTASGGEAIQQDQRASVAYMYATATASMTNYRIRSQMRLVRETGSGGAIEVDFRVNPATSGAQYFCNWEPNTSEFLIMHQTAGIMTEVLDTITVDTSSMPGFTPMTSVTMNIEVVGSTIRCWLDGLPDADLTVTDGRERSGAVGFKTYALSAAYELLEVCPL